MTKKLIEVALPLEAINAASAREKSIRHGHPSTLHLWWARRPLAAARAVIFAQMVDDPSSYPDLFPTDKAQEKERQRLFKIIEDLVKWENTTNEEVLQKARNEIWQSWRRACAENADHPRAAELFDRSRLPGFHDPFAGGGALPLEAQRLGLQVWASELNPVAVLINKAMIEIPPRFAEQPPVNPWWIRKPHGEKEVRRWRGAQGLAEDVGYYGQWMRDEAERRIGDLYPRIEISATMAKGRPDLRKYVGRRLTVVAWLWARTVRSPNPAFSQVHVPLTTTFVLSDKAGKEVYIEPIVDSRGYRFDVRAGKPEHPDLTRRGTKAGESHSTFKCLMSGTAMPFEYLRAEGRDGRMGARLMAIVAEGDRGNLYLPPSDGIEEVANKTKPSWVPDVEICHWPGRTNVVEYGLTKFGDLFSPRQLVALTTFSDLVLEARELVKKDLIERRSEGSAPPQGADMHAAIAYADAVALYLGLAVGRSANYWSSLTPWGGSFIVQTFGRQAIPMVWDHAEGNPFSDSTGNWSGALEWIQKVLATAVPACLDGKASQGDAQSQSISQDRLVSADPPYYDNIAYADLSDFFYVWLRRSLKSVFPDLFATVAVPKAAELIASPYRHGSKEKAEVFFLSGMTQAMSQIAAQSHPAFPVTIYYAFKQSETKDEAGTTSTGWVTFLDAVLRAGFAVSGTWPIRTERDQGLKTGMNVLASSIVLVCRPRTSDRARATRREFVAALKAELPVALARLQRSNIAPVDLAQAAIGPGMAVYTRYEHVLDAAGKEMNVREALALINQTLDEVLAEQEGDFDADSRWALQWFEQFGFSQGEYGVAEVLATAQVTSIGGLVEAGLVSSRAGKVRLLAPKELPAHWDPAADRRLTTWEMVHHLIRLLDKGEGIAADLVRVLGGRAEIARELAYRLYTICERKKRPQEALAYNALVQSWPEILRLAREGTTLQQAPRDLFDEEG